MKKTALLFFVAGSCGSFAAVVATENTKLAVMSGSSGFSLSGASSPASAPGTVVQGPPPSAPVFSVFGGGGEAVPDTSAAAIEEDPGFETAPPPSAPARASNRASRPEYEQNRYSRRRAAAAPSSPPPSVSYSPKGGYVAPPQDYVVPAPSPLTIWFEGGYQSAHVYRGVDQVGLTAVFDTTDFDPGAGGEIDTDIWFIGAGIQYAGFSLSAKRISSFEEINPFFHPLLSAEETYTEYLFDLNYTLGIVDRGLLDATVGYELRYFEEDQFWNTDMLHTFYGRLKCNAYPLFRPSITLYHTMAGDELTNPVETWLPGVNISEGTQVIGQIDGALTVAEFNEVSVGIGYYVELGYNFDYLGDFESTDDAIAHYGGGVSLPVSYRGFTVTPSVNYHDYNDPIADVMVPEFWWGVKAAFTF